MPSLKRVTTTQKIEFEIDLIELAYDHVDSVDDLTELLEGVSSPLFIKQKKGRAITDFLN